MNQYPPYAEYRADGWPLCPVCGEDELWSGFMWDGSDPKPPMQAWIDRGLRCYRCGWDSEAQSSMATLYRAEQAAIEAYQRKQKALCDSLIYQGFRGEATFDHEACIYHGQVVGIRDVITFQSPTVDGLRQALADSVEDYLAFAAATPPPPPPKTIGTRYGRSWCLACGMEVEPINYCGCGRTPAADSAAQDGADSDINRRIRAVKGK